MRKLTVCCTLALAALATAATNRWAAALEAAYLLEPKRTPGTADLVEALFEVGGDLKLVDSGKVRREKMSVTASFVYDEKVVRRSGRTGCPVRSIRHYARADGTVRSGKHEYAPALRKERRLIVVDVDGPELTLFSPRGALTWEELQLIDVPANSLLLDRLLPMGRVAIGGTWNPPDDLVPALLRLEAVATNDVQSVLREVRDGIAVIEMYGRVEGEVRGAMTQIELKGKYYFDLKGQRITWLGLLVEENRSTGHVDTGFEAVARLRMRVTPGRQSGHLAEAALANVALEPLPEPAPLSYESTAGGWRLLHGRRWYLVTEGEGRAVFRLLDRGDKLAQCNVSSLPPAANATKSTLGEFQNDVAQALGKDFQSFSRVSQWHHEADYRVFRVVAEGESSEVAMQWIYYLVTDRDGRRVVLVFVIEKDMLVRFGQSDRELVGNLRLLVPRVALKPD